MGSVCCCLHMDDLDDQSTQGASFLNHCICFGCLTSQFMRMYNTLFQRGQMRAIPSSSRVITASAVQVPDGSTCDTYRSPPRPLPYDDPRFSPVQRDGLILRREKSSCHCHEESEPLRSNVESDLNTVGTGSKWKGYEYEGQSKLRSSESSLKKPSGEVMTGLLYIFTSPEDEDICPTCLEEYNPENPKITLKCSHHFHLGCIYEWMERSDACPVCGKAMAFDETT